MPCATLLALSALSAALAAVPPDDYDSWPAAAKVSWWKANLDVGGGGSADIAPFWAAEEFPDAMHTCMKAEFLYAGGLHSHKDVVAPYACRQMGLHPTGVVAWVRAVWEPNNYTGMFQKSDLGFARWGYQSISYKMAMQQQSALDYANGKKLLPMEEGMTWNTTDCSVYDCFNVSAGDIYEMEKLGWDSFPDSSGFMALKFFRDGVPTASVHTGQSIIATWNPLGGAFSNLLTNLLMELPNDTAAGSMSEQGAQRGTLWPGFTGLHDMAMYDQQGQLQHDIHFPYQVVFVLSNETEGAIPESVVGDYKETIRRAAALQPGTKLYDIYAKDTFASPSVLIGRLELASKIMLSADTDRQVFFTHVRYDRDVVLRPEFLHGPGQCLSWWACPVCPTMIEFCSPTNETIAIWDEMQKIAQEGFGGLEDFKSIHGLTDRGKPDPGPLDALRKRPPVGLQKFRCAGAGRGRPSRRPPNATGASFLQKRTGGARRQQSWGEGMRDDDLKVEPLSQNLHNSDWFCESDPSQWPNAERPIPWTTSCKKTPVPGRYQSEPEFVLSPDCVDIPQCSKTDGMWYSRIYPCRCGGNTCISGQLCRSAESSCEQWGPYR